MKLDTGQIAVAGEKRIHIRFDKLFAVVLASELYDEADYIRDIKTFKALAGEAR